LWFHQDLQFFARPLVPDAFLDDRAELGFRQSHRRRLELTVELDAFEEGVVEEGDRCASHDLMRQGLAEVVVDGEVAAGVEGVEAERDIILSRLTEWVEGDEGREVAGEGRGDMGGDSVESAIGQVVGDLLRPAEASGHILVDGVDAAAADRVVGVILEEVFPGLPDESPRVGRAEGVGDSGEGLGILLQSQG
jgi:hypothetical protein